MGRNPFREPRNDPEKGQNRRVRLTDEEKARLATFRQWYEKRNGFYLRWRATWGSPPEGWSDCFGQLAPPETGPPGKL